MYLYWASCVNGDGVRFFELRATEDRGLAFALGKEYREYSERNFRDKKYRFFPESAGLLKCISKWRVRI